MLRIRRGDIISRGVGWNDISCDEYSPYVCRSGWEEEEEEEESAKLSVLLYTIGGLGFLSLAILVTVYYEIQTRRKLSQRARTLNFVL